MDLVSVKSLYKNKEQYLGKKVTVGGWLRSVRDSKTFGFLVLSDGTFFDTLQVVYADKLDNFAEISKLNVGAAVIVTGELVATPQESASITFYLADKEKFRLTVWKLKVHLPRIIHYRRRDILLSI